MNNVFPLWGRDGGGDGQNLPAPDPGASGQVVRHHGQPPEVVGPVLPVRRTPSETAGYALEKARVLAVEHGRRSPRHAGRLARSSGRGVARLGALVRPWLLDEDARPVIAAEEDDARRKKLREEHRATVRNRLLAVAGCGIVAAAVLSTAPPALWAGLVAAVLAVMAWLGRQGRPISAGDDQVLDVDRDVVIDTAAIVAACKAAGFGAVTVRGPIARDNTGVVEATTALIELPAGGVAKRAAAKRAELASGFGPYDESQVILDPVKGHARMLSLWLADEDPFGPDVDPAPCPLADAPRWSVWEPIPAAYTPRGRVLAVDLGSDFAGLLIAGEPGGGKSAAQNTVTGGITLDPFAELWLADGKGIDSRPWWDIAHRVSTADRDGLAELVGELLDEHRRRAGILGRLGEKKVTARIATEHDLHMKVLVIDELAFYVADKSSWKKVGEPLRELVSLCRATGLRVITATQKPEADVIPSKLRDMFSGKWALRCTTPAASDTILGTGWASRGANAALIDADQKGAGYLKDEQGKPVLCRSFYLPDDQVDAVAARAYELRAAAGTLPVRDWPPRLLADALVAFVDRRNMHSVDLLAALDRAGHELADTTALADALRPYGVRPTDVDVDGRTRKGYKRAHLVEAIDAGPTRPGSAS